MTLWSCVASAISDTTQRPFAISRTLPIRGGSISQSFRLEGNDGSLYFLKLNDVRHQAMLVAEFAGLETIGATNTLRVPHPITVGVAGDQSFIVLEHLDLLSHGDAKLLGEQLAALHRCTSPQFGFSRANFIGTSSQPNTWTESWVIFWQEQRLGFQLNLARLNGSDGELLQLGARLLESLPAFFAGHTPQPSLLHGDLWGGNHAYLADGTPTIFDPATYYGDRECDLAMTELFGGYPSEFYAAYCANWPLDRGYSIRRDLYNLYHVLNHANLFGGSYVHQSSQIMRGLLANI